MHEYHCTFLLAFWYQLNILESTVTFAEIHTRNLCAEMYPNGEKTQFDFYSRCCCNIKCLHIFHNLAMLADFLIPHTVSTQHPTYFPSSIPLVLGNFSPSINPLFHTHKTHSSTSKAFFSQQTHIRVCSSISLSLYIYSKTPQPHSLIISGRGKFLAQSLRPCWMLGGIPPSINVWGVISEVLWHSREDNITGNAQNTYSCQCLKMTSLRLQKHLPRASELEYGMNLLS